MIPPKDWKELNLYDIFNDKELKHLTKIKEDKEKLKTFLNGKMTKINEVTRQENDLNYWVYYMQWILKTQLN